MFKDLLVLFDIYFYLYRAVVKNAIDA